MRNSDKKMRKPHFKIKTCFALILILYFAISIVGQQSKLNYLNSVIAEYNVKIEEKQGQLEAIEDKKKKSTSDETIEHIARERLGLVRNDETVFVDITGK